MPTVLLKYKGTEECQRVALELIPKIPGIVAPLMNIEGRELHDGGVGEDEIMVEPWQFSPFALNVKDIRIVVEAHNYPERIRLADNAAYSITEQVRDFIIRFKNVTPIDLGVSVEPRCMGYTTTIIPGHVG